jgi:nicotinate-nucleotide adenylyltransferase
VGVLGGTFNPIHLGHLHIAKQIQKLFSLSHVHFVVAATPPHKSPRNLIPFAHRYAMVSLAVAGTASFIPSMVELESKPSPYSIDTMRKLARILAVDKGSLFFIAGGDSLLEINTWRQSEKLLNLYNFVFALRPGIERINPDGILPAKALRRMRDFRGLSRVQVGRRLAKETGDGTRIYLVDIDAPDISATKIRRNVSLHKPIHRLVPGPVGEYIRKLHLYGGR